MTQVKAVYYTIYQITNLVNGKIYIGKHITSELDDDYMGSGKHLRHAIANYGVENFQKDILFVFDNEADMNAKEAELVTAEFVLEDTNYNLNPGGNGGWGYINSNDRLRLEKNRKARIAANNVLKAKYGVTNTSQLPHVRKLNSERLRQLHKSGELGPPPSFKGKRHREESKRKIGEANSKHQLGSKNSQYGTVWITNGQENKKISKDADIPDGWRKGRTLRV